MRGAALMLGTLLVVGCGGATSPTGKFYKDEPVEHWLALAKSPDAKQRKKAVDVLGNVGVTDPGAVPALIEALKDPSAAVRTAAAYALAKIGPAAREAGPALRGLATDRDKGVRDAAAVALRQLGRG